MTLRSLAPTTINFKLHSVLYFHHGSFQGQVKSQGDIFGLDKICGMD